MTEQEAKKISVESALNSTLTILKAVCDLQEDLSSMDEGIVKKAMCEITFLEHLIENHLEDITIQSLVIYKAKCAAANDEVSQ